MRHHLQSVLVACAAVIVLACAGCQLTRINARTFTLTSTLSVGIGDLAPGCHLNGDGPSLLPVRSSVHFTADVSDDATVASAPVLEKSACARDHHAHRSNAVKID